MEQRGPAVVQGIFVWCALHHALSPHGPPMAMGSLLVEVGAVTARACQWVPFSGILVPDCWQFTITWWCSWHYHWNRYLGFRSQPSHVGSVIAMGASPVLHLTSPWYHPHKCTMPNHPFAMHPSIYASNACWQRAMLNVEMIPPYDWEHWPAMRQKWELEMGRILICNNIATVLSKAARNRDINRLWIFPGV